jgi:hypothetical protein
VIASSKRSSSSRWAVWCVSGSLAFAMSSPDRQHSSVAPSSAPSARPLRSWLAQCASCEYFLIQSCSIDVQPPLTPSRGLAPRRRQTKHLERQSGLDPMPLVGHLHR